MAASASLNIVASTKEALKSINEFQRQSTDSLKKIENSFSLLKTAAIAAVGIFVGGKIADALHSVTEEAIEQAEAINKLNAALQLSGNYSEAAANDMLVFADAIQATTTVSGDQATELLALATNLGLSAEQAKLATKAAVDLSAATGRDLTASLKQVALTFNGSTKEVARLIPEIKTLSKEQLKAGEAAKLLAERFAGAGEAARLTFAGSIKALNNSFGDFLASIGGAIVQNKAIIAVINLVSGVFDKFKSVIEENRAGVDAIIESVALFATRAIPGLIRAFGSLISGLVSLSGWIKTVKAELESIGGKGKTSAEDMLQRVKQAAREVSAESALKNIGEDIKKIAAESVLLGNELFSAAKKGKTLGKISGDLNDVDDALQSNVFTLEKLKDKLDEIRKDSQKLGKTRIQSANEQLKIDQELADATEAQAKRELKLDDNAKALIKSYRAAAEAKAELAKGGVLDIQVGDVGKGLEKEVGGALRRSAQDFENKIKSISLGDILSGVADIGKEIASGIGYVLSGNFFSDIFSLLDEIATSPEKITETFRNIRDTIIKIIEKFPELVAEFVRAIPEIVSSIAKLFPELITTLLDALPKIVSTITAAFVELLPKLLDGIRSLIERLPEILSSTIAALPTIFSTILKSLPGIITALFKAIPEIFAQIVDIADDLSIALAENLGPIITSLVDGLANAMPIVVDALVSSLINEIETGRITSAVVKGIIKAIPTLAVSLQKAYTKIIVTAAEATGKIYSAIYKKIFKDGVVVVTAGIVSAFQEAGKVLPGVFQQLFTGIRDAIVYAGLRFSEVIKLGFAGLVTALQEAPQKFLDTLGALPGQIEAVFINIGSLLSAKFQELNAILINGATNLVVGIRTAIAEFGATASNFFSGIGATISGAFQTAGDNVAQKIKDAFSVSQVKIPKITIDRPAWLDELKSILSGGATSSRGRSALSTITGGRFATGGTIPTGFPNDTFPAKLSSGEMVIPRDDVSRLSAFLDRQQQASSNADTSQIVAAINQSGGGEKQLTINLQVGQENLAKAILNINRQGFRTA